MAKQPTSGDNGAQAGNADAPSLNVLGQYVKDLSFESPSAPASLAGGAKNPQINIQINVGAQKISDDDFEVELKLEAKAEEDEKVIFEVELSYGGIFRIKNIPEENLQPVVLIECPRLLFPFARQIVAEATRNGGFPPLMVDPVDFAALYQQRMAQQEQAQQKAS